MYGLISGLIIFVCILTILIVLVQNSKGGGLASSFSSSNQVMGVRRTTDFLEKATWYLIALLFMLSILASAFIPRQTGERRSVIEEQIQNAADPDAVPVFPQTAPDEEEVTD